MTFLQIQILSLIFESKTGDSSLMLHSKGRLLALPANVRLSLRGTNILEHLFRGRYDNQHNDTQHNGLVCNTQQN